MTSYSDTVSPSFVWKKLLIFFCHSCNFKAFKFAIGMSPKNKSYKWSNFWLLKFNWFRIFPSRYYYKVFEQDGKTTLLTASANMPNTYIFKSRGRGRVELGLKHSTGWLKTDFKDFIVYGQILGLKMLLNGLDVSPYKCMESTNIKFKLWTSDQIYQIKRFLFC